VQLVETGVLKPIKESTYASLAFVIPEKSSDLDKTERVGFLFDLLG
jgi:hypothetical protein